MGDLGKRFGEESVDVLRLYYTRGVPCQHGFMCGCKQWSNYINESN